MFQEDRLYQANDPALKAIAPYSTMAQWRCQGRGPAYFKYGGRVVYKGADLNAWLAAHRVEPRAA